MSIEDKGYLNREPAPRGKLLAYWKSASAERIDMTATLGLLRRGQSEYKPLLAELQRITDYVELLLDQIDNGELTDTEADRYQRILADEDDDEEEDEDTTSVGYTTTQQFVLGQLRVAGGPVDINDLVKNYYGRTLTEFDRRHARIRQAVARLAWPHQYNQSGPAVVSVELPANRVFGAVRAIEMQRGC